MATRKASVYLERSNKTFECRETEDSKVDPSSSFDLDSLGGDKLRQGERYRHYSIDNEYLLYKDRVYVPALGDFRLQILKESHHSPSASHPGI